MEENRDRFIYESLSWQFAEKNKPLGIGGNIFNFQPVPNSLNMIE